MIVTAWKNGKDHISGAGGPSYGIKMSIEDRDRYFKRAWGTVFVQLAGSQLVADANVDKDSLWVGSCRELISKDFGIWLRREGLAPWKSGQPPKLQLTPVGERRFRLTK